MCKAWWILVFIAATIAPLAADTPVASKATPPAKGGDAQRYAVALQRWTTQMQDALAAGQLEEARARALDILDVDPDNVRAWHAMALTYVGTRETSRAADAIEKAMEKSKGKPDRALVLNFGMIMIANRNPMRAARFLLDYLQDHQKEPVDETVLNALAVALTNADANSRKAPLFAQAGRAYEQFNAKLESTRKGEKRWGLTWLPESEAKSKLATWNRQEAALDKLRQKMIDAGAELAAARRNHAKIKSQAMLGGVTRAMVTSAEDRVTAAQRAYATAREAYAKKDAQVERPTFPREMATVTMDAVKSPGSTSEPFARPTEVATAATPRLRLRPQTPPTRTSNAQPKEGTAEEVAPPAPELFVRKDASRSTVVRKAGAFPVGPDLYVTAASAVRGAKEITLSDVDGGAFNATVVRVNDEAGVALLRSPGRRSAYLRLADQFKGGAVQCVSLTPGLFETRVELIAGSLKLSPGDATLSLQREPRRSGTPLVVNKQVVGVQLAERGLGSDGLPVATLDAVKRLCGADVPSGTTAFGDPAQHVYELVAVCETK